MVWASNPGRSVPYSLQQACFRRDGWTCVDCGYEGRQHNGDLHADHIVERAVGGADTLDNLATRCVPCHEPRTQAQQTRGRQRRQGRRRPRTHPADA